MICCAMFCVVFRRSLDCDLSITQRGKNHNENGMNGNYSGVNGINKDFSGVNGFFCEFGVCLCLSPLSDC